MLHITWQYKQPKQQISNVPKSPMHVCRTSAWQNCILALSEHLCNITGLVLLKGTVSLTNTINYFWRHSSFNKQKRQYDMKLLHGVQCHSSQNTYFLQLLHWKRSLGLWPSTSPDLSTWDYNLWVSVKDGINVKYPQSLQEVQENIWSCYYLKISLSYILKHFQNKQGLLRNVAWQFKTLTWNKGELLGGGKEP
jgi:hypothetical protein